MEPRITGISAEEIAALPSEKRELWLEQDEEDTEDFVFMVSFLEELYPLLRKHHKISRAQLYFEDFSKSSDKPLYAAFDRLLSLTLMFRDDPDFFSRFTHQNDYLKRRNRPLRSIRKPGKRQGGAKR